MGKKTSFHCRLIGLLFRQSSFNFPNALPLNSATLHHVDRQVDKQRHQFFICNASCWEKLGLICIWDWLAGGGKWVWHLGVIFHIKNSKLGMETSRKVVPFPNSWNQESPEICMVVYLGGVIYFILNQEDKVKSKAWPPPTRSSTMGNKRHPFK